MDGWIKEQGEEGEKMKGIDWREGGTGKRPLEESMNIEQIK